MKKALLIPIVALTIVGGTLIAVMPAQAFARAPQRELLVQKLSERFGLPDTEVEAVMQEVQQAQRQERQQQLEVRLDEAVKKGNLTQEQKSAILAKHQELLATWEAGREQFQNMTPEERQTAREKARTELDAWAAEHGIDLKFFMIMRKGMGKLHR
jgi:adenylate cyclase